MSHTQAWHHLRSLFPAWSPTDEETALYQRAFSPYEEADVVEAVNRHKMEIPSSYPVMASIINHCRALKHDRTLAESAPKIDPEYESTRQWIERTIASASPEEIEAVKKRVPMAVHMPGLIAAGIETIRKERKRWN